jgi:FdhD protein
MSAPPPDPALKKVPCSSFGPSPLAAGEDLLVVEEPLEYRIGGEPLATVMRTPGNDRELAVGFLFNEGWIAGTAEIGALSLCASGDQPQAGNVADLIPASGRRIEVNRPRLTTSTSGCGVCGKRTIEEVLAAVVPLSAPAAASGWIRAEVLRALPERLRAGQRLFERTGALHAAGLFDREGRLVLLREDVGRHNAVDKLVGASLLAGRLPLHDRVLLVSGRVSFEIVQKALRAGIPLVAAISGVSSLARDLASEAGVTLVGFLRGSSFKVYAHPLRIEG